MHLLHTLFLHSFGIMIYLLISSCLFMIFSHIQYSLFSISFVQLYCYWICCLSYKNRKILSIFSIISYFVLFGLRICPLLIANGSSVAEKSFHKPVIHFCSSGLEVLIFFTPPGYIIHNLPTKQFISPPHS